MVRDVIIVGAGPAGLFASHEASEKDLDVLVVDKGKDVEERGEDEIMSGIGGAGTYSDGTINLRPEIGGDLREVTSSEKQAWDLVDRIAEILSKHGMPEPKQDNTKKEDDLKRRAASVGAKFFPIRQAHIGSDKAPALISSLKSELADRGVEFRVKTTIEELLVEDNTCKGVITEEGEELRAKNVVLAPGRIGMDWVRSLLEKYAIESEFAPIDIGVRVEVPSIIMEPVIEVNRDPKFHFFTKSYDDFVRTFCTNPKGFVVKESYNGFVGVNGYSRRDRETENTNFAFLVRTQLTEPLEDTTQYGRAIAQLATTLGGGRPIVQRLGDLRDGRRSTEDRMDRNPVQPTLEDVTPGDISMALPQRAVRDIKEGLQMLDEIIPGVDSSSTLLYAPEIKFYANHLKVGDDMETSIDNLYAAGDGAGLSHDIVNAAATGMMAGRGIREKF